MVYKTGSRNRIESKLKEAGKKTMTEVYPLVMQPSFRSGQSTPWGGRALKEKYGKDTPEEITGESLEISAIPGHESLVENGAYRGKPLREVFELLGDRLTGKKEKDFPLMLKLLDARQCLSVQVHPDDLDAQRHEGKAGKSEAWYILDAEPGARLVYGIEADGGELRSIVETGELEKHLHWVEAHPGDVFYIPSGTIHALGPGIQCYEIQQSSDVTYRFWDWNRVGKDGKKRELHLSQALDVSNPDGVPESAEKEEMKCAGGTVTCLVDDPHFSLYAVDLDGTFSLPVGKMLFVTPTEPCTIRWEGNSQELMPYQSALIPAGMGMVEVSGSGRMLLSCA